MLCNHSFYGKFLAKFASLSSHLLRSHGSLVQPRACSKFSLSEPTLDDRYFFHAKFHTSAPPCFIAVQYTTSFWFGDILWIQSRSVHITALACYEMNS